MIKLDDSEVAVLVLGSLFMLAIVLLYARYLNTGQGPKTWERYAIEQHTRTHELDEVFKLGQKNPDAASLREAALKNAR